MGMRPQLFIPGGTFHVARLKPESSYACLGQRSGLASNHQMLGGRREELIEAYPELREEIRAFTDRVH